VGTLDCEQYQVDDGTIEGHSSHLGCTGLYSDWAKETIAPGVIAFKPGYVLWSDGAEKRRWIFIPPGTQIDSGGDGHVGGMDGWIFPIGTKAWKQFGFGSRRVETRFLWKRETGWFRATYVWSADESVALEYTGTTGVLVEGADSTGPSYEIPPSTACVQCHAGAADTLLGFEAVGLGESAEGLTLDELIGQDLLTQLPAGAWTIPGDPDAKASLGWLHANCGNACHNQRRQPGPARLHLRLNFGASAAVEDTDAWTRGVGQASTYLPGIENPCGGLWSRIEPGRPECSVLAYRDGLRDPYPGPYVNQMPPLLSHRVPTEDVATLSRWILSMPVQPTR
jgi:hypothetical protein